MGRKKIQIEQIADSKLRAITFNKRKNGLIKKAAELSLLCNVNLYLLFEDHTNNSLIQFSTQPIAKFEDFLKSTPYNSVNELIGSDYPNFFEVKHYRKTIHREKEIISETKTTKTSKTRNARTYSDTVKEEDDGVTNQVITTLKEPINTVQRLRNASFEPLPQPEKTNKNGIIPESTSCCSSQDEDEEVVEMLRKKRKPALKLDIKATKEEPKTFPEIPVPTTASNKPSEEMLQEAFRNLQTPNELFFNGSDNFIDFCGQMKQETPLKLRTDDLSAIIKSFGGGNGGFTPNGLNTPFNLDTAKMVSMFGNSRIFNFANFGNNEERNN